MADTITSQNIDLSSWDTLYKLRLYIQTEHAFILIQNVPLHLCYMFRPLLRPSSGMLIQKSH